MGISSGWKEMRPDSNSNSQGEMSSTEIINMWVNIIGCLNIFSSLNFFQKYDYKKIIKLCHWAYNTQRCNAYGKNTTKKGGENGAILRQSGYILLELGQ